MEAEQLRAAKKGNQEAIAAIIETYQRPVFNLCYRMLGNRMEAEDIAQEALIKAITKLHLFDPSYSFKPWVLRIASNTCIDCLRRRKPEPSLDDMGEDGAWEWFPGHSPNPEREVMKQEQQSQVQDAVAQLQPLDRTVVALFYWEGLSYADISEVTDLTVPAIKSRLYRARRAMAEHLTQEAIHVQSYTQHA
ncbi:MAG: sigma-70 family RNA polymerase sigma factor [Chloroflexi bacterium]|jgi:RNA polymerase sigma-70 factor (ECF subfamily)|nr:sigma-70 family RNA polymerase sigma factor [Chloroflexota bacterium]